MDKKYYTCPACGGEIDPDNIDVNNNDEDGYNFSHLETA